MVPYQVARALCTATRPTEETARPRAIANRLIRMLVTWGPAALWAAVLFLLSSVPDVPGPAWLVSVPGADKVAHAGLYAVLGATLAWANHRGGRDSSRAADVLVVGVGVLYGASDEWHQSFVPGRDTSAADFTADVVGLAIGYVATKHLLRGRGPRSFDSGSPA